MIWCTRTTETFDSLHNCFKYRRRYYIATITSPFIFLHSTVMYVDNTTARKPQSFLRLASTIVNFVNWLVMNESQCLTRVLKFMWLAVSISSVRKSINIALVIYVTAWALEYLCMVIPRVIYIIPHKLGCTFWFRHSEFTVRPGARSLYIYGSWNS